MEEALLLLWQGVDPETAHRVVRYWVEMSAGMYDDPRQYLTKQFSCYYDEIVLIKDIDFTSLCRHHLLPFSGVAHVGYIPVDKVVGLSKIPRVVEAYSLRPQLQEKLTQEIGVLIQDELNSLGVIVVMEAKHSCMSCRGIRKANAVTVTSFVSGAFKSNPVARAEVLELIK